MPLIVNTRPDAARRGRIRTVILIVATVIGVSVPLLGGAAWWTWVVALLMGLILVWLPLLDIYQRWWPPSQWIKAARHHP